MTQAHKKRKEHKQNTCLRKIKTQETRKTDLQLEKTEKVVTTWSPCGHQVVTKWSPSGHQVGSGPGLLKRTFPANFPYLKYLFC